MAPINAWPVLFLTFPILVWLVDGSAAGRWSGAITAAIAGWCFGFGYFVAGLYWIGYAFLVDAKTFGWLLPVAVVGLPAYLALFTALGLAAGATDLDARPVAHSGACRHADRRGMAARPSAHRLSLEHVRLRADRAAGAGAKRLAHRHLGPDLHRHRDLREPGRARRRLGGHAASVAPAGDRPARSRRRLTSFGAVRLWQHADDFVDGVKLRIMQPNLQQDEKFNYAAKEQVMERYLRLSDRATGPQLQRRTRRHAF